MAHRWPARPNEPQHEDEPPRLITGKLPNRRSRIKGLGNGGLPQVVYPIFKALYGKLQSEVRYG